MAKFTENIGTLSKTSNTTVQLSDSLVKLGGQFFRTSSLNLSTAVSGVGGLDTGSIAASSFYYVYAVRSGSSAGLVASLSNQKPVGFNAYKKVGAFYTDSGSLIFKAYVVGEINTTIFSAKISTSGVVSDESYLDWINGNASATSPYTVNFVSGIFSSTPNINATAFWAGTDADKLPFIFTHSSTSVVIRCEDFNSAAIAPIGFNITAQKQGVDAVQPDWKDY